MVGIDRQVLYFMSLNLGLGGDTERTFQFC